MSKLSFKNFIIIASLMIISAASTATANDLKITLKPTNPIDCRYSTSWWVTTSSDLRSSQTADDLVIEVDFSYGECAKERFIPGAINSNWPPERMITIMKEGFKTPWNYKAKIKIDARLTKQEDGSEVVTAILTIPKKDLFKNESGKRRYEVSFKPGTSDRAYFVWYLDITRDTKNSAAIMVEMNSK